MGALGDQGTPAPIKQITNDPRDNMYKTSLLAACAALAFTSLASSSLFAQSAPYDPYAPQVEEPPIAADGSLNWPVFYKSASLQANYEKLWNMGACLGTNRKITIPVANNRLDINKMPEGKLEGIVMRVGKGQLFVRQADGKIKKIAVHPAGVSRIDVTGDVPARWLKPGMGVRLVGQVDESGHGPDTLEQLDIVTIPPGFEPNPVVAGKRQSIVAVVASLRGNRLLLKTPSGSLRRLSFQISDETVAHVQVKDLAFASVGDKVEAKGHFYSGDKNEHWVFASDVTVSKPEAPSEETASTDTSTVAARVN